MVFIERLLCVTCYTNLQVGFASFNFPANYAARIELLFHFIEKE